MEESVLRRKVAAPFADFQILAEHRRKSLEFLQRKLQKRKGTWGGKMFESKVLIKSKGHLTCQLIIKASLNE